MGDLATAIDRWQALLGAEHVITDPEALRRRGSITYGEVEIPAVLFPHTTTEVSEVVKIAAQYGVEVYPISTGKNWGYGSGAPVRPGCVVIDLKRMDRIRDFDEDFGYITIEPGVSFRMVEDYLESRHSRHFIAAPGTTPEASLIGNMMERGWGFGPHSARFEFMCALEVVLADGSIVRTGNGRFPGSRSEHLFRWGVGPWVDGLFTQSNFGIVTQMTMFLALLPDQWASFVYKLDGEARLPVLLDVLRDLRMKQIVRTNFKLQNFYRMFQTAERWPEGIAGPDLPPEMIAAKKLQYGMGDWNGFGALYCYSDAQYQAERDIVDAAIRPHVDALLWLDQDVLENQDALADQVKAETGYILSKALDHFYINTRLVGIDKGHGLKGAYFHKPDYSDNPDLDLDRVGVMWVDPIVPFRGSDMRETIDIAEEVMRRHGFESNIGFNVVTERSMFMTCLLLWDRDITGDDERGLACAAELVERFMAAGYTLGRLANPFVETVMNQASPASKRLLARLKDALDPQGILAPGRYEASAFD